MFDPLQSFDFSNSTPKSSRSSDSYQVAVNAGALIYNQSQKSLHDGYSFAPGPIQAIASKSERPQTEAIDLHAYTNCYTFTP